MIEPKVIKGIMFGAGCLLGIRSCILKSLDTSTPMPYAEEIAWHINELFKANNIGIDPNHIGFDISKLGLDFSDPQMQIRLKRFLNEIYIIYFNNREMFNVIWRFCQNKELTFAECAIIVASPEGKRLLLACAECVNYAEQIFKADDSISKSCEIYFKSAQNPQDQFERLLKPIIALRLSSSHLGVTPQINLFNSGSSLSLPAKMAYNLD